MVRISVAMLLACLGLGLAFATQQELPPVEGWRVLPESPMRPKLNSRHDDLFFTDPDTGWVVNVKGEIYKTTDGGESWIQQLDSRRDVGPLVPFRSVGFANSRVGWAGTLIKEQVLFETRDGGETWTDISNRITGPMPKGICGIWVVNERVIYGAGRFVKTAHFIKSTDGGQSWTSTDMSALAGILVDVYFFDENNGMIVGGTDVDLSIANAVILVTSDGGDTWEQRYTTSGNLGEWGWKIAFPTPTTGYVTVERRVEEGGAKVLKTTDGGATWEEFIIENSKYLQGVGFATEDLGWVSGGGTASMTETGGKTWRQIDFDGRINRFRMFGDSLGYAVGRQVYKYTRR